MGLVVDTGPLVAFLNSHDQHHGWAVDALSKVRPPLATCDAVLSEACFLLARARRSGGGTGATAVLELVDRGLLTATFAVGREVAPVSKLMTRYASVPMSLADACLVRMAELDPGSTVITLDEDFRVYRRNGRGKIRVIAPWSS